MTNIWRSSFPAKCSDYFRLWMASQSGQHDLKQAGNEIWSTCRCRSCSITISRISIIDPPSFVNNRGIGITVSAQDPVRIIKFLDFLLEEENQIMNQWGIEGVTYEVDEQRTPVPYAGANRELFTTRNINKKSALLTSPITGRCIRQIIASGRKCCISGQTAGSRAAVLYGGGQGNS